MRKTKLYMFKLSSSGTLTYRIDLIIIVPQSDLLNTRDVAGISPSQLDIIN